MFDESKRQRSMRRDVYVSRQALAVVVPVNRRIGPWQASAARLVALAAKLNAMGRQNDRVVDEAMTLSQEVTAELGSLSAYAAKLPPAVAASNRIVDTTRALSQIRQNLDRAVSLLRTSGSVH